MIVSMIVFNEKQTALQRKSTDRMKVVLDDDTKTIDNDEEPIDQEIMDKAQSIVSSLFKLMDRDGDGKISFFEYQYYYWKESFKKGDGFFSG